MLKEQYNYGDPFLKKYGCLILSILSCVLDALRVEEIDETQIVEIKDLLIENNLIKDNGFGKATMIYQGDYRAIIQKIAKYYNKEVEVLYFGLFKHGKWCKQIETDKRPNYFLADWRKSNAGKFANLQHLTRIAADGTLIYNSWPNSSYMCFHNNSRGFFIKAIV